MSKTLDKNSFNKRRNRLDAVSNVQNSKIPEFCPYLIQKKADFDPAKGQTKNRSIHYA